MAIVALLAGCTGSPPIPLPVPATGTTTASSTPSSTPPATTSASTTQSTPSGTDRAAADELPELEDVDDPDYRPATRTEELALQIEASAKPTLQQAIDALDLYQPMPGATPTTLPKGDGLGATYTLALVAEFKDRMSPEQRAVVDAIGGEKSEPVPIPDDGAPSTPTSTTSTRTDKTSTPTGTASTPTGTTSTPIGTTSATGTTAAGHGPGRSVRLSKPNIVLLYYYDLLTEVVKAWKAHRPDLPHPRVLFAYAETDISDTTVTTSSREPGSPGDVTITMYPALYYSTMSEDAIRFVFAAEYFRAIQLTWSGGFEQSPWVQEGSAEWAAYDLYRGSYAPPADRTYAGWFTKTQTPLGARMQNAWPFFESLYQYGADPYPSIKLMAIKGNAPVRQLLAIGGLDGGPFASFRSSQSLRGTGVLSRFFFMDWPGRDPRFGPTDNGIDAPAHGRGTFTVNGGKDYSHPQRLVPFTSDVDTVTISPNDTVTTLTTEGVLSIPAGASITLCVREGACECPDGAGGSLPMAALPLVISMPEQAKKPSAALRSDRFKTTACRKTPPAAQALGDPHMVTFDGTTYDLALPGEYVLLRDPVSKAQVQIRVSTDHARIAAVAVTAGDGHRVTITNAAQEADPPVLRRDGRQVDTSDPTLADEWQITDGGKKFRFAGPDGLTIGVAWTPNGTNVTAVAQKPSAGRLQGLLGDGNGIVGDDFRLPDGTIVAAATDDYFSSWWVTDSTTLFDYEDGKTTESYRVRKPVIPPIPDTLRAGCRDALGADAIEREIDMCAFDVAVTGNTEAVTTMYVSVVNDRVENHPALIDQPDLGDGPGDDQTTTTTTGPSVGTVTGDGPALTLSATISSSGQATGVYSGGLALKAGTVLVARSTGCPHNRDVSVKVTFHDHSLPGVDAMVCDPRQIGKASAGAHDIYQPGEAYIFVAIAGDYDVAVSGSGGEGDVATTVEVYADPDPRVVQADAFDTTGYTGTLDGIGRSVLAWSKPGDKSIVRTAGGDIGEVCVKALYGPAYGEPGIWDLYGICGHNPDQGANPYPGDGQVPYLIFSRTPGKHTIAIKAGG